MHTYELAELGKTAPTKGLPPIQENLLKTAKTMTTMDEELVLYAVEKILKQRSKKVVVKWLGYDMPTWEPASSIQQIKKEHNSKLTTTWHTQQPWKVQKQS